MSDLFGNGLAWPYRVGADGRLAQKAGSDRLNDSVEQIVATPQGICPMDPQYGMDLDIYQLMQRVDAPAWALANAIEYGEPRAEAINVVVESYQPEDELLQVRCEITPLGENSPLNRTLNLYELAR